MTYLRTFASLSLLAVTSFIAKADTIINLNATQPTNTSDLVTPNSLAPSFFSTVTLGPGTYSVSVVGTSVAGAVYNGWNQAMPAATDNEWEERIGVNTTGGTFQIQSGDSYYYSPYPNADPEPFSGLYGSAASALAAAQAAGPYKFTLASSTAVTFYIPDEPFNSTTGTGSYPGFLDNSGGVSLDVASVAPVPEPSSLMLLGTGVLSAAGILRRRVLA